MIIISVSFTQIFSTKLSFLFHEQPSRFPHLWAFAYSCVHLSALRPLICPPWRVHPPPVSINNTLFKCRWDSTSWHPPHGPDVFSIYHTLYQIIGSLKKELILSISSPPAHNRHQCILAEWMNKYYWMLWDFSFPVVLKLNVTFQKDRFNILSTLREEGEAGFKEMVRSSLQWLNTFD